MPKRRYVKCWHVVKLLLYLLSLRMVISVPAPSLSLGTAPAFSLALLSPSAFARAVPSGVYGAPLQSLS